ncbi:MAG: PIN domain-containing protein [Deltaproteobacteria bacterium]|nr:PIN domain-containing protein [Deltaproteobacteria bacterium]
MKVIFDTNVVLDVLLDREPFATSAALLFSKVERGELFGCLCATTITTIHYLVYKALGIRQARKHVGSLLSLFEIAPVNRAVLEGALKSDFEDFEDAVIHEASIHAGVQALVTRDVNGFRPATIPVYSPDELMSALELSPHEKQ